MAEVWRDAVHSYRQIIEGRNAADMSAEEFLSETIRETKS